MEYKDQHALREVTELLHIASKITDCEKFRKALAKAAGLCTLFNVTFGLEIYILLSLLGSGVAGCEEVKSHPFFAAIDWNIL